MKKITFYLVTIIILPIYSCSQPFNTFEKTEIPIVQATDMGCPFVDCYSNSLAKTPWDMIIFDNQLFVGSGNYNQNCGPAQIACYDLATNELKLSSVPDEEINKFAIINETLIAPGIDPMQDWAYGNYYIFQNNSWKTVRSIPYGIHTFQIIEFDNKLFAALGTEIGHFPISVSENNGKSFVEVKVTKNNCPSPTLDSFNDRIYNMFVIDSKLFAVKFSGGAYEVFMFNDGQFDYITQWIYDIVIPNTDPFVNKSGFIASITYNNTYYFSTGYLFKTQGVKNIKHIAFNDNKYIIDLYENNGHLFALAIKENSNKSYTSAIYKINDNSTELLFEVTESNYAISFAVNNENFYLGFGYCDANVDRTGKIIKYTYKGEFK